MIEEICSKIKEYLTSLDDTINNQNLSLLSKEQDIKLLKQKVNDLENNLKTIDTSVKLLNEKVSLLTVKPIVVPSPTPVVTTTPTPTVTPVVTTTPQSFVISTTVNHFNVYLTWPETVGADFYKVYKNGVEMTVINGCDTWDGIIDQDTSVTYKVVPCNKDIEYQSASITVKTLSAPVVKSATIGDYTRLTNVALNNNVVTGYKFSKNDIGKVISLSNCRIAKWYRSGSMWAHLFIKDVNDNGNAIVECKSQKNIALGTPANELVNNSNTFGYFATNNFDILRNELSTSVASTLELTGTVYIDPSRSTWYNNNIVDVQGNGLGMIKINNSALLVKGDLICGGEDLLGHKENNIIIPYCQWYPMILIEHKSGMFAWKGNVRGCETVPIMNRTGQVRHKFYTKDIETPKICQFIYSGVFGNKDNYQSGFTNLIDSQRGTATSGKDLLACIDSTLHIAEPFVVRPFTSQNPPKDFVSTTFGKRFLLRNTIVSHSAFCKTSEIVRAFITNLNDGTAKITVNSSLYPNFTFYSNVGIWSRLPIIFKSPTTPIGGLNSFDNTIGKLALKINNAYEVIVKIEGDCVSAQLTKPMIFGEVMLITAQDMQPTIPWEGHVLYTSSLVEIEMHNVNVNNLLSFLIRSNNSDNYEGFFNQYSLSKITYTPPNKINPGFDDIKQFGGYVQFAEWPGPPFIQAVVQGFNPNKRALLYKCQEPTVNNQNGNLTFLKIS